ncbi:DUF1704 domain-containing protein [Candidatus Parcubacteria bacterium]|jgi:alpha-L-glutamate ligase-like protein/uncharacterized protein (TIGR02421 family)|nr:DUF1704 domain-containing protein [Candidatus Parcubacteria bacterium]MBT3949178.1 DUF1704 domain-containing protein [Candidatus Parcubacteria bacterium]
MKFFSQANGILGMNARNLHYVGRYNTSESKKFADNKLYTKNFLMTRGIGVAKVYLVIKKYKELSQVNPKTLPQSFVIKPNRGFGGEGIMVIREHKGNIFTDVNGNDYEWKDLYHHMVSILDGKYAISGLFDAVIVEELLENHEYFSPFVERGLPDIRIIVFNYVPIIAMLRLPTEESQGKANLHLGAVGAGIDIATGKATHAVQYDKFIRKLPNGERVNKIELPMWNEILTMAAKAQQASQIKFLAVDIVLTKTGIKILELNARAGLGVQIANQIPLKHRLRKVEDLKVTNPEKGVEVSKALFSSLAEKTEKVETVAGKKVIGLFEKIDILNTNYTDVPTKIDPHTSHVLFDESLTEISSRKRYIDVVLRGERVRFPFKKDKIEGNHKVVIGGKILKNFLIDPSITSTSEKEEKGKSNTTEKVNEKIITNVDKKLTELDKHLNILSFVKPINLIEEKERFLSNPNYSPQFIYKKPEVDLEHILRDVSALPRDIDHPLADLFISKIDEIISKMHLIDSVGTDGFTQASEDLYGKVDNNLYNQAVQYIKKLNIEEDKSKILGTKQIIKRIEHFLSEYKLTGWKVKVSEKQTADIAINKSGNILLKSNVKFTENRLKAVIAHEICTHVYRYENGAMQKYKIFAQGTSNYLQTEEGLAVYNQKAIGVPLGEKDKWAALRVIAAYKAKEMSFKELYSYLKYEYELDDESAWKSCIRAKRGITNTSSYGAFTRDIIYFKGYLEVKNHIEKHGRRGMKELYVGKISIDDLKYLVHLGEYKVKYLPPEKIELQK